MTERTGVGLIGAGMIGQGHAYALRLLTEDGDVRPVAITDFSAEAVESARAICPFERIAPDAQAVIDDPDVEAVVIVTPTTTHQEFVRAVVEARKPLLCEKPLATRFDIVADMCALVASSGLTAQVGFHSRFHPLVNELVRLVASNELGAPMGYTLRDDQYWPTGDVVPGHSSWRSERAHAGAARSSSTRSTAPTSSRGSSGRPTTSTPAPATSSATTSRTPRCAPSSTRRASSAP